ncbi:hypothetical protein AALB81_19350 [Lachnospiraceae bacterium 48-33]
MRMIEQSKRKTKVYVSDVAKKIMTMDNFYEKLNEECDVRFPYPMNRIGNGVPVIIPIQMTILSFINFMPLPLTIGKSAF